MIFSTAVSKAIQILDYISVGELNMQNKFEVYPFLQITCSSTGRERVWMEMFVDRHSKLFMRVGHDMMNENENKTLFIVVLFVFYHINSTVCACLLHHRSNMFNV